MWLRYIIFAACIYNSTKKKGSNGKVYTSVLLCEKYRDNSVVKTRVVLNLSKLPNELITNLKSVINKTKGVLVDSLDIKIERTIDYGLVFTYLEFMDRLRISETLDKSYGQNANIIKLMILGKLMTRGSKLCIFNWIKRNKFIADKLSINLDKLKVDNLYFELGELSLLQEKIEKKWNIYHKRPYQDVFLYDITSTYFEGSQNQLAAFGYNRDGKKGKLQITIGLITDSFGFPLKIQVFEGNINDYKTVNEQLISIKESFNAKRIILVGDRGMRIRMNLNQMEDNQKEGMFYIRALTSSEITAMLKEGTIQLNLFAKELVEIEKDGIRYILSTNPILEKEKGAVRDNLKQRFEKEIYLIKESWQKRDHQNKKNKLKLENGHKNKRLVTSFTERQIDNFKYRANEYLKRYKMGHYYSVEINNDEFSIDFNLEAYQLKKKLDGKYIIETTVEKQHMNTAQVRQEYKNLQNVEHGFRDLKTERINIRPVFHQLEPQTRGHVFVCMFAYAIAKEMENLIFPWIKDYNKKNKCKLSFSDIEDELKNIKISELKIGHKLKEFKMPDLTPLQVEIFKILKLKPENVMPV